MTSDTIQPKNRAKSKNRPDFLADDTAPRLSAKTFFYFAGRFAG
jgi:hypothetical protein